MKAPVVGLGEISSEFVNETSSGTFAQASTTTLAETDALSQPFSVFTAELQLNEAEKTLLAESSEAVKSVMNVLDDMNANA